MIVTVIGTGDMGSALVQALAEHHAVNWVGRTRASAERRMHELNLSGTVSAREHEDAFDADVTILALWHRDLSAFTRAYGHLMAGKVIVDIANPFTEDFEDFDLPYDTSAAEELQKLVPLARVVGAFKNTYVAALRDPHFHEGVSDVLVTGDDADAKATVLQLLAPLPFRVLDAGNLRNNRTIERMTLLAREVGRRHHFSRRLSYRMLGQEA